MSIFSFFKRKTEVWETTRVVSSFIKAARYNKEAKKLIIVLNNGKEYSFKNVNEFFYTGFLSSDSKGRFFNEMRKMKRFYDDSF